MAARYFRDDRARHTRLRNDLTFDLDTPAAATAHTELDIKQTKLL
jgi:hypothetical protein